MRQHAIDRRRQPVGIEQRPFLVQDHHADIPEQLQEAALFVLARNGVRDIATDVGEAYDIERMFCFGDFSQPFFDFEVTERKLVAGLRDLEADRVDDRLPQLDDPFAAIFLILLGVTA